MWDEMWDEMWDQSTGGPMTKTKITTLMEALRACQDDPEAMRLALDTSPR